MAKTKRAENSGANCLQPHDPYLWICPADCPGPHFGPPDVLGNDGGHVARLALITGLISLGFWPLGPIAATLGILACRPRWGLRGVHLWMSVTGTVAGFVATFGLIVYLVARLTIHVL